MAPRRSRIDWRRNSTLPAMGLLVVLLAVNGVLQTGFFRPAILASKLTDVLPLMLIAVGQCYVVLGGSIDLSLGAIVSLVNVIVVVIAEQVGGAGGLALGMAAGLAAGMACGAVNGALVSLFRLQAVVTTFATSIVYGGLALIVLPQAGGALPSAYCTVYGGKILGLPFVLVAFLVLLGLVVLMSGTRFHLHLLAVGSNRQGAYQSGLPVGRIRLLSHALAGLMAALAALAILGVTGAGDPLMGQAFTLGSVSAAVLGGAALGLINNVIFFANIDYQYQSIGQGVIVLLAPAANIFVSRKPG